MSDEHKPLKRICGGGVTCSDGENAARACCLVRTVSVKRADQVVRRAGGPRFTCGLRLRRTTAQGQKRRFDRLAITSDLPRLADNFRVRRHVSKVPEEEVSPPPPESRPTLPA